MKVADNRATTAVPGPVPGTRITEAYARLLARDAYFWAWPMANIYNKRLAFGKAPEPGLLGGVLLCAPLNRIAMLTDYIDPAERAVACPKPYRRVPTRRVRWEDEEARLVNAPAFSAAGLWRGRDEVGLPRDVL